MNKIVCSDTGDALIRYVIGAGFMADGYFCLFDGSTTCYTEAVIYDGTGFKAFSQQVPYEDTCTGRTFVDYDGTGMKPLSKSNTVCGT
jgi:hypothetical protein